VEFITAPSVRTLEKYRIREDMPPSRTRLQIRNIKQGKKTLGIVGKQQPTPIPTDLFKGETLQCHICKIKIKASPDIETHWYYIRDQKTMKTLALCPNCQRDSKNIQKTINDLVVGSNRLVLFQGESAKEFPLTPSLLNDVLRILVRKEQDNEGD
jgi:hypothetical protein